MIDEDSDDDSGEEEILEESSSERLPVNNRDDGVKVSASPPQSPKPTDSFPSTVPETSPLLEAPPGWTTHQSRKFRDSRFPGGYVYFCNPATNERRWAVARPKRPEIELGGLYYSSPPMALTSREMQELVEESKGHVKVSGAGDAFRVEYFCDQDKRWAFQTCREGLLQLCHLVRANQDPLALCDHLIAEESKKTGVADENELRKKGRSIYSEKKHLIHGNDGEEKVTWSQDEYAHPGMQLVYLSLKSWQRFTETWAMLERAYNLGLFEAHKPPRGIVGAAGSGGGGGGGGELSGRPVRVLSIGGGPGFELVAFERFFRSLPGCAETPLQLVSLDLMPGWRPYVEVMGMQFGTYDIKGPHTLFDIAAALNSAEGKGPFPENGVTYVLISYVMIYVSTPPVCDMLRSLLETRGPRGVRAILVSERGEETKALGMMEQRGTQVHRLIDQSYGVDERQSLWLSSSTLLQPPASSISTIFPNVPFEDGKKRKRKQPRVY